MHSSDRVSTDCKDRISFGLHTFGTTANASNEMCASLVFVTPQHGFYKRGGGLTEASERKMYWAAASAWGIDSIWEDIQADLDRLHTGH